jgi:hypothetical protein
LLGFLGGSVVRLAIEEQPEPETNAYAWRSYSLRAEVTGPHQLKLGNGDKAYVPSEVTDRGNPAFVLSSGESLRELRGRASVKLKAGQEILIGSRSSNMSL